MNADGYAGAVASAWCSCDRGGGGYFVGVGSGRWFLPGNCRRVRVVGLRVGGDMTEATERSVIWKSTAVRPCCGGPSGGSYAIAVGSAIWKPIRSFREYHPTVGTQVDPRCPGDCPLCLKQFLVPRARSHRLNSTEPSISVEGPAKKTEPSHRITRGKGRTQQRLPHSTGNRKTPPVSSR